MQQDLYPRAPRIASSSERRHLYTEAEASKREKAIAEAGELGEGVEGRTMCLRLGAVTLLDLGVPQAPHTAHSVLRRQKF